MGLLLALDFGGTKHTASVISTEAVNAFLTGQNNSLRWISHERIFSPAGADARYDIETMFRLGQDLLAGEQPDAVGVSFGGPVDSTTGTVRLSHHVPGWEIHPSARC